MPGLTTNPTELPLVLVADANPDSLNRRTRQLEARGFRVEVARTSFEAIVKASCHMPAFIVVDASLAGLDQHELITIPSLPDTADWENFETARKALGPNLSRQKPATRYGVQA